MISSANISILLWWEGRMSDLSTVQREDVVETFNSQREQCGRDWVALSGFPTERETGREVSVHVDTCGSPHHI
jgi:hypothetical protein